MKLDGTGQVTLRNRVSLRCIVPYGASVPKEDGLKLRREESLRVQEGPARTLHPKASQKPNPGEVVVGSSPPLQHSSWDSVVDSWSLQDQDLCRLGSSVPAQGHHI